MKKLICLLLCLVMALGLLPMSAIASGNYDAVVVAGDEALCGSAWSTTDMNNEMTLVGTDYVKVYEDVPAGTYSFKITITQGDSVTWLGDLTGNNYMFTVTATCDVTITFDSVTNTAQFSGDNVVASTLEVDRIVAVGNGSGNWLNGASWDPAASANNMTEISSNVYQITYADVAAGSYEFKFAANGTWADSWGGSFVGNGMESEAVYNGSNIRLSLAETTTVTLTLDLTGFDYSSKSGATFTVSFGASAPVEQPIESIEISGVTAPVAGAVMSFDFDLPIDAGYEKCADSWGDCGGWVATNDAPANYSELNDYSWNWESNGEQTFTGGMYYTFVAWVQSTDGYYFDTDVTATVNGESAGVFMDTSVMYDVWYTFYCEEAPLDGEIIDEVEVEVAAPVVGEDATWSFTVPSGAGYVPGVDPEGNVAWMAFDGLVTDLMDIGDVDVEVFMEADAPLTFETGKTYCVAVLLDAEDGYAFNDETLGYVNGEQGVAMTFEDQIIVYYIFGMLGEEVEEQPIDSVEITDVTAPVPGATADYDYSIPAGAGYEKYDDTDEGDYAYWIVSDTAPADYESLWDGLWYAVTDSEPLVFEAGKYYTFLAMTQVKDGYYYASGVTATLNGKDADIDEYESFQYDVWFTFYCAEVQPIESMEISDVTAPVAGETASYDYSIPADAGYQKYVDNWDDTCAWAVSDEAPADYDEVLNDCYWYWASNEEPLVFEAGKYYTFVAMIQPKDGYYFADSVTATVNGEDADVGEYEPDQYDVWFTFYCEEAAADEIIESVEITGVTAPALDGTADWGFTVPEDAGYVPAVSEGEIMVAWAVSDTKPADVEAVMYGEGYLPGDELTFGAGKYYTFVAVLFPEDGYVFSDELTATVNGKEAMVIVVDGGAYVAYTYEPLTEEEEIIPGTGDEMPMFLLVAVMVLCSLSTVALLNKKRFVK